MSGGAQVIDRVLYGPADRTQGDQHHFGVIAAVGLDEPTVIPATDPGQFGKHIFHAALGFLHGIVDRIINLHLHIRLGIGSPGLGVSWVQEIGWIVGRQESVHRFLFNGAHQLI